MKLFETYANVFRVAMFQPKYGLIRCHSSRTAGGKPGVNRNFF